MKSVMHIMPKNEFTLKFLYSYGKAMIRTPVDRAINNAMHNYDIMYILGKRVPLASNKLQFLNSDVLLLKHTFLNQIFKQKNAAINDSAANKLAKAWVTAKEDLQNTPKDKKKIFKAFVEKSINISSHLSITINKEEKSQLDLFAQKMQDYLNEEERLEQLQTRNKSGSGKLPPENLSEEKAPLTKLTKLSIRLAEIGVMKLKTPQAPSTEINQRKTHITR